jgi:biotin operon repressor
VTSDLTPQMVLMALGRGADNARPIGDIAERLNLLRRTVESAVQELRLSGVAVCSDGRGIFLGDRADLERTIASLQRRVVQQHVTLRAMRRQRDRMAGQTTLWSAA